MSERSARREERLASDVLARLAGCPPAEALLAHHERSAPRRDREAIARHVEGCSACAAALDVLASGEDREEPAGSEPAVIPEEAAARSESLVAAMSRDGADARAAGRRAALLGAAAAVALVASAAVAAYLWWGRPRAAEEDLGEYRSAGALDLAGPLGALEAAPGEMRWAAHPLAASYRVVLLDAALNDVWTRETPSSAPELILDPNAAAAIRPGPWFAWQVVALGRLGQEIARSPVGHFRVDPGAAVP